MFPQHVESLSSYINTFLAGNLTDATMQGLPIDYGKLVRVLHQPLFRQLSTQLNAQIKNVNI